MTLKTLSSYGKGFQLKVLGALLTDRKFLLNVSDLLNTSYFDSDAHKWIVDQILQYFRKYNTTISLDVLKVELKKVDNEVLQVTIKEELKHSYKANKDDIEYIESEFTDFCKNQKLKAALLESADLLNQGQFEIIRSKIEEALKAGMDKEIGHDYKKDIETRYRSDYRPTIPTPWEPLNQLLQGGFGPGDLGIVFGNPGGGKCIDYNTEIEIEYPIYELELKNSYDELFTLRIEPWDEFNIDGIHLYGWQVYNLFKK